MRAPSSERDLRLPLRTALLRFPRSFPLFAIVNCSLLSLSLSACGPANTLVGSDSDLQRKLSGTWLSTTTSSTGIVTTNRTTFRRDGTFAERDIYGLPPGHDPRSDAFDGRWQIRDGYLTSTVTNTTLPELVPVGRIYRSKIIRLSDRELVCRWEERDKVISLKRSEE
jgi:hypothetical protein